MLTRAINDLIAVAHGMNPASPLTPIQAMMKLQQIDQQLKQGKHPDDVAKSTVLDQTIQGIQSALTPQVAQAPQGMPMPPQGGGAPQGMPMPPQGGGAPQGMPMPPQAGPLQIQPVPQQQAAQQQLPPQQPPMPMAHGGITHIPSNLHFKDGGIIAFGNGLGVKDPAVADQEAYSSDVDNNANAGTPASATAEAAPPAIPANIDPQYAYALQLAQREMNAPVPASNYQSKEDILKTAPEWQQKAAAVVPGAQHLVNQQDIFNQQQDINKQQQQNLEQQKGLPQLFAALRRAGRPTGQRGLGAFLGELGDAIDEGQQKSFAQKIDLANASVKNKASLYDAQNAVEELQRAAANGDVDAKQKAQLKLDEIRKDLTVAQRSMIDHLLASSSSLAAANINAISREKAAGITAAARITAAGTVKPPKDQAEGIAIFSPDVKRLHPDWGDAQVKAEALRQYQTNKQQAGLAGVIQRSYKDAIGALEKEELTRTVNSKPTMTEDEKNAYIENYMRGATPVAGSSGSGGAAPAPAPVSAPSAPPSIASIKGAPSGSTIGKLTPQGWEVLDKNGKILGHSVKL